MTHLVLGAERRTLKVLLAVAAGAAFVTPAWVAASLAAGRWLPLGDGEDSGRASPSWTARVRFSAGAARAATSRAAGSPPLLAGERVLVVPAAVAAGASAPAPPGVDPSALRTVAAALGAALVASTGPARPAPTLVVVSGGGATRPAASLPPGILLPPGVPVVGDEWLLTAAEEYRRPALPAGAVPRNSARRGGGLDGGRAVR
jgi:hypothetical protein